MARKVRVFPAQRTRIEALPEVRCFDAEVHEGHEWTSGQHVWVCPGRRVSKLERLLAVLTGHADPDPS